jgi:hypothetical protein
VKHERDLEATHGVEEEAVFLLGLNFTGQTGVESQMTKIQCMTQENIARRKDISTIYMIPYLNFPIARQRELATVRESLHSGVKLQSLLFKRIL